jgi:hypothetical protein
MPKKVACPVCKAEVKVPRDAEPGAALTCPGCDEVFTPPHLKKEHDPEAEAFGLAEPDDDAETIATRDRKARVRAIKDAGREYERETTRTDPPPVFGGFEIAVLVMAVVMGLAAVGALIAAKRAPSVGEVILVVLVYGVLIGVFVWWKLKSASKRQ